MSFRTRSIVLATILSLFLTAQAFAAVVAGVVRTDDGAPLPGVLVTVSGAPLTGSRTDVSDRNGVYRIDVPQGEYRVSFALQGFRTEERRIASAETEPAEAAAIVMRLLTTDVVTVEGASPRMSRSGMKTDTDLRDIPQSVQVVPKEFLEEQRILRAYDAVRNVPGVSVQSGAGLGAVDGYMIRGFITQETWRDGYKTSTVSNPFVPAIPGRIEMSNVERIEVLKGPASVLYGRQDLGGVVNVVTKKPLNVPYRRFEQTAGSHSMFRSTLDLAGPINESKTLLYRVNGAYEQGDTFRDFIADDIKYVAPSLTWIAGERTSLTFNADYLDESRRYDSGLIAVGDRVADIPIERNLRDPGNDYRDVEATMGTLELDQGFGRGWNLRVAARGYASRLNAFTAAGPATLKADNRTITRTYFFTPINDRSNLTGQAEVTGGFQTGSLTHQVIAGIEQGSGREELAFRSGPSTDLDIFDPVYGISNPAITPGFGTWQLDQSRHTGAFIQDQISFSPRWKAVVGGRYDVSDEKRTNKNTGAQRHQEPDAFSPRLGLIFQPNETWSYYASYSESFLPRLGSRFDGSPFVPEKGEQFELGTKADFLGGRVSGTAAVFELTRANVTTIDPQHTGFSIQVGEQRSRGLELSLVGLVTNNLRMIGSYTYTDAEVTKDNSPTIRAGNALASIPEHMASLWSSYTFSGGALEGLGAGAGLFYVSDRYGDIQNTFTIGSYVRADASVFYRFQQYMLGLNVKNLTNTRYMESSLARTSIAPGQPRSFYLTAGLNF